MQIILDFANPCSLFGFFTSFAHRLISLSFTWKSKTCFALFCVFPILICHSLCRAEPGCSSIAALLPGSILNAAKHTPSMCRVRARKIYWFWKPLWFVNLSSLALAVMQRFGIIHFINRFFRKWNFLKIGWLVTVV